MKSCGLSMLFLLLCFASLGSVYVTVRDAVMADTVATRPPTVADSIQMVQLAEPERVAVYSPDGTKLVTVVRKGKLENNTNEYLLLLWRTGELFQSPIPDVLLTMSSSSNRAAIENPTWLADSETIAFLGEHPGEPHQLYSLNTRTRALRRIAKLPTNLTWFSVTPKADAFAFTSEAPEEGFFDSNARKEGLTISNQRLAELIRDRKAQRPYGEQLFFQRAAGNARRLESIGGLSSESAYGPPTLSPDGRYIVLTTHLPEMPESWKGYRDPAIQQLAKANKLRPDQHSWLYTYELVDTRTGRSRVLFDAPTGLFGTELVWSPRSDAVVVSDVYLPLENTNGEERTARQSKTYAVEVKIPTCEITKISDGNLKLVGYFANTNYLEFEQVDKYRGPESGLPSFFFQKRAGSWEKVTPKIVEVSRPDVAIEQGMNTPPKLIVLDPTTHRKALLLDLNPQFKDLHLATVAEIRWRGSDGHEVRGGLYYPLDHVDGKRYPLVIQTHGWTSNAFMMDGIFQSPFAAQALAAKGIAVLQADENFEDQNTPGEVNREVATLEGAVDYLDQTGLIDRDHVGVIGFSRTCLFVKYLLTHSHYYFAAASVQDGIDAGYWQYLGTGTSFTFIWTSDEDMNGGMPFGEGLKSWIERSPSFSIQNVRTPVRIVAPNPDSLLYEWEWFAALSRLGKPVELVYMQDGEHILQRPWERRIAQQGNVDWFCFWLKSEEDPDPAKAEQYARWRKLREQQERARDDTDNSLPLRPAGSTHTRGDAIHGLGPH